MAYATGQGIEQDYAEAVSWTRKAAEQEFAGAEYNLGVMYDNGQGLPQDFAEAMKWYLKAAAQGDSAAQNNLGLMYEEGRGLTPDYISACMWYDIAISSGGKAAELLRRRAEGKMTSADVEEARRRAQAYLQSNRKLQ